MSAPRTDPFSDSEVAVLRDIIATLEHQDSLIGGWSTKIDARQTGFSLHIKFDKKVGVQDAIAIANVFDNGTLKLYQIIHRVLGQIDAAKAEAKA